MKLYRNSAEYPLTIEPLNNSKPVFEKDSSLFAQVGLATGVDGLLTNVNTEINCYPNPFSDDATIEIKLMKDSEVQVEVLNQLGQRIKYLATKQKFPAVINSYNWNGRNAENAKVVSVIYYVQININGNIYIRETMLNQ